MSKAERHEPHILLSDSKKTRGLGSESAVQLAYRGVGHTLQV